MNHIKLNFEEILHRLAAERGLTVSDIKGTIDFKGTDVCMMNVNVWICNLRKERVDCYCETDFEKAATQVFDRYFHVSTGMYHDIAQAHINGRDFDTFISGVHIFAEAGHFAELYTDRHLEGEGWEDLANDYDENTLRDVYDRLIAEQEAADAARRETELQLRRTA
jgi:hypothetical protein